MWVRCSSPKGEIFIMYPQAGSDLENPHASFHRDGAFHQKSHNRAMLPQQRQPLTAAFIGSEHLGIYQGHGTSMGAVCDPNAFDAVVIVEPGILGPRNGSVGFDLLAPGFEATWERDIAGRFYFGDVVQREIFRAVLVLRWQSPYKGHDGARSLWAGALLIVTSCSSRPENHLKRLGSCRLTWNLSSRSAGTERSVVRPS